jgi:hypothetical protein
VAEYFIARSTAKTAAKAVDAWRFSGDLYPSDQDFSGNELYDSKQGKRNEAQQYATIVRNGAQAAQATVSASPPLAWLWERAAAEWL